jgi:hypothetical protein
MLDMDKVKYHYDEILKSKDNEKMVEFAKEIIPKLIEEVNAARIDYVDAILGDFPMKK